LTNNFALSFMRSHNIFVLFHIHLNVGIENSSYYLALK
jgi:hypothetical protein